MTLNDQGLAVTLPYWTSFSLLFLTTILQIVDILNQICKLGPIALVNGWNLLNVLCMGMCLYFQIASIILMVQTNNYELVSTESIIYSDMYAVGNPATGNLIKQANHDISRTLVLTLALTLTLIGNVMKQANHDISGFMEQKGVIQGIRVRVKVRGRVRVSVSWRRLLKCYLALSLLLCLTPTYIDIYTWLLLLFFLRFLKTIKYEGRYPNPHLNPNANPDPSSNW